MARGRELKVYLTSDVSKFGKGLRRGESAIKRFGKIAAVGIGAAAAGALAVGTEAVKAAIAQEKANARLGKSLENLGLGDQTEAVLDQVDALQKMYGVSEDDLLPAFQKIVGVTKDTRTAFGLLQAAMDVSVATGKPLETVMQGIARAAGENGSTGALKRLVPELDTAGLVAGDTADLMKRLNKQFGGQAAAEADTMAGTMDRFGIHVGEINEALGEGVITGFMDHVAGDAGDKALENMEGMEDNARLVGEALGNLGANSMQWAGDFILGLEAISLAVDTWSLETTRKINDVLDLLGFISDEEGQRRSDVVDRMLTQREWNAAAAVNGPGTTGTAGGSFTPGPTPYFGTSDLYSPTRRRRNSDDTRTRGNARASLRSSKTRQLPE